MTHPRKPEFPLVLGLTGGIASGKSTVAGMLGDLGAEVIDADRIAHQALASEAVCRRLGEWPEDVFDRDGHPDRPKIAKIVFEDRRRLQSLNAMVHPETRRRMRERLEHARRERAVPLIVIDAPLLLEGELDAWCDRLLFVDADRPTRTQRARAARDWDGAEVDRREQAQTSLVEKRRRADIVIDNNGSLERTRTQVEQAFRELVDPTSVSSDSRNKPRR